MLLWLVLPFYDFRSFRSFAVNSVYKMQFFTFMFINNISISSSRLQAAVWGRTVNGLNATISAFCNLVDIADHLGVDPTNPNIKTFTLRKLLHRF